MVILKYIIVVSLFTGCAAALADVDGKLAATGKKIFETKCSACHKIEERYVGPALKDVTKRRSTEWIAKMISNPAEMLENDSTAQELLAEYMTPMTFQNVSKEDVKAIIEFFKQNDSSEKTKAKSKK